MNINKIVCSICDVPMGYDDESECFSCLICNIWGKRLCNDITLPDKPLNENSHRAYLLSRKDKGVPPRRRRTGDKSIKKMYEKGKTSTEIADFFGVTSKAIRQRFKVIGIDVSENRRPPIYSINENFFDEWNSEMAYVLGFILTDGCVSKNTIGITQAEKEPLIAIRDMIGSDKPIYKRKNNKDGYIYDLVIGRKHMVKQLNDLGIHSNKSLTVELPEVPDKFFPDFLRGVIDGDGWIDPNGYSVVITSGSEKFSHQLMERLIHIGFNFRIRKDDAWRVILGGQENVMNLRSYLYHKGYTYGIQRKKARFDMSLNFLKPKGDKTFGATYKESSREKIGVFVNEKLLKRLRLVAKNINTYPNHLLEKCLSLALEENTLTDKRLKGNKSRYKTTIDRDLLLKLRRASKERNTPMATIIDYSIEKYLEQI